MAESKRHIDNICVEEIAALVIQVLHQTGSGPGQDVVRSVCRLIGMAKAKADAEGRVLLAVEKLKSLSRVLEVDGYLRLVV